MESFNGYVLVKNISSPDVQRAIAFASYKRSYLVPLSLLEESVEAHTGSLVQTERLPFDVVQDMHKTREYCKDGAVYALHKREIGEDMVVLTPTPFHQGETHPPLDLWKKVSEYHELWKALEN